MSQIVKGNLPITIWKKEQENAIDYSVYGTSEGAGVACGSGEPEGYKISLTNTSGQTSDDYNLYIGDSKLGEEEYLDYAEQKIYHKAFDWTYTINTVVNPQSPDDHWTNYRFDYRTPTDPDIIVGGYVRINKLVNELTVDTEGATIRSHTITDSERGKRNYTGGGALDTGEGTAMVAFFQLADGTYIYSDMFSYTYEYVKAHEPITPPGSPFIYPTDPPAPLPAIQAYRSENMLTSTETVGNVFLEFNEATFYVGNSITQVYTNNQPYDLIDSSFYSLIANSYDSTQTYETDSYCIYNYCLYKCITAITTPEVFNPAKWQQLNLSTCVRGDN